MTTQPQNLGHARLLFTNAVVNLLSAVTLLENQAKTAAEMPSWEKLTHEELQFLTAGISRATQNVDDVTIEIERAALAAAQRRAA